MAKVGTFLFFLGKAGEVRWGRGDWGKRVSKFLPRCKCLFLKYISKYNHHLAQDKIPRLSEGRERQSQFVLFCKKQQNNSPKKMKMLVSLSTCDCKVDPCFNLQFSFCKIPLQCEQGLSICHSWTTVGVHRTIHMSLLMETTCLCSL